MRFHDHEHAHDHAHLGEGWDLDRGGIRTRPGRSDTADEHPPDLVLRARRHAARSGA